jgi:hypothetical protein
MGESEAWDGPREGPTGPMGLQEGSVNKSEGYNGSQRGSKG